LQRVSVVLNVFKRSANFSMQVAALRAQTIPPIEILVWENGEDTVVDQCVEEMVVARANRNFGVWSRFAFALNASGDYILVLDDDTIPGKKWIENCLTTMKTHPGLLGTRGLRFSSKHSYAGYSEVGLYSPNQKIERADIVGHAWFFRRELLAAFWAEYANRFPGGLSGEDIHFSYAIQKVLGLNTFVPPHPTNDFEMWGSKPDLAKDLGSDKVAISAAKGSLEKFEKAYSHYVSLGFRIMVQSDSTLTDLRTTPPGWGLLMGRLPGLTSRLSGTRLGLFLRRLFLDRT